MKPSEEFTDDWIYARNENMDYPASDDWRSGKWLIFQRKGDMLDNMWARIEQALEAGKLGKGAKVSTKTLHKNATSPKDGVICVYTYSLDDLDDVRRVRQALRELGVTWKIAYKLEALDIGDGEGDMMHSSCWYDIRHGKNLLLVTSLQEYSCTPCIRLNCSAVCGAHMQYTLV